MNAEGRNCHVTDRDGPPVNCMVNASALDPHICRA
jgi:hypothetical protein